MNEIHINALLAIIGTALAFISIIATAVWTVAAIKNQTNGLRQAIETLSKAAEKLEATVERIEKRQFDHELRLSLLERGISVCDLPTPRKHETQGEEHETR